MRIPTRSLRSPLRLPRRRTLLQARTSRKAAAGKLVDPPPSLLAHFKPWLDTIQAVATILAVVAGGYWFLEQRLNKPNIKLTQTVTQRLMANGASTLITVDVRATNIGKVMVALDPSQGELRQVNPPLDKGDHTSLSFILKPMQLEPGESDQAAFRTLTVPKGIQTLQVHSQYAVPDPWYGLPSAHKYWHWLGFVHFENRNYWSLLSAVDLGAGEAKTQTATSVSP